MVGEVLFYMAVSLAGLQVDFSCGDKIKVFSPDNLLVGKFSTIPRRNRRMYNLIFVIFHGPSVSIVYSGCGGAKFYGVFD